MTNGGYKIIDLEGLIIERNKTQTVEGLYEKIERSSKSGKPILINNVKFYPKDDPEPTEYSEITTPIFFQIITSVDVVRLSKSYIFILPNGITGTINEDDSIYIS